MNGENTPDICRFSEISHYNNPHTFFFVVEDITIGYIGTFIIPAVQYIAVNETKREAIEAIGKDYVENQTCHRRERDIRNKYQTIAAVVQELFDQIPVPVKFQTEDPYDDYDHMAETVGREQQLRVYSGHASHPVMSDEDNLKFRAVHDWYGHLKYDVDFTTTGEYHKWLSMCADFPDSTHGVLFAEVVGQLGAIKYLDNGFNSDRYEQKAIEAPPWWIHKIVRGINNSY